MSKQYLIPLLPVEYTGHQEQPHMGVEWAELSVHLYCVPLCLCMLLYKEGLLGKK